MATISLPTPLRAFAKNQRSVQITGQTVGDVLENLTRQFPEMRQHLFSEDGTLRSFVNVYLGDEDIRYLQGSKTPVKDDAQLSIIPSIAGGIFIAGVVEL